MPLHSFDIGIILVYFIAVLWVGTLKRTSKTTGEYLLMARKLSLPAFVMTLVSTWYGGILGVSEFSTTYGISNWVIFGLPYYIFGIAFALLVAKRARQLEVASLPEIIRNDYGKSAGKLASIWVLLLANPAPYILTLGILLNYFLGISITVGIISGAFFSLLYIYRGGLSAVVNTDKIQFSLMFAGFIAILIVLSLEYKTPLDLWNTLPESHRSLTGGHSYGYILVWFFIGSWTLVDPGFHQRVYATRSPRVARNGILFAVLFWFIFDIMTTLTGLYAFSFLPSDTLPSQAFLALGNAILPTGLKGLFFVGIMATVMSTLDSNTLISGITLGKDILSELKSFKRIPLTTLIKYSMIVVLLMGILMAIWIPSVIDLWYTFGTIAIPALLVPTLASISGKPLSRAIALYNLTLAPLASILWFTFAKVDQWNYFLGIEPFYPGLVMSLLILTYFNFTKRTLTRDK